MTDHLISIGDVELRLDMIARGLGIPAETLKKLAAGELVAVPVSCLAEMQEAVTDTPDNISKERALTAVYEWCEAILCPTAPEAPGHD